MTRKKKPPAPNSPEFEADIARLVREALSDALAVCMGETDRDFARVIATFRAERDEVWP